MDVCRVEDLELFIREIKSSNKEVIRLFQDEARNPFMISQALPTQNCNSRRELLSLIDHHLQNIEIKLENVDIEILKWNLLKQLLESTTSENVAVKNFYYEEQRRSASLRYSLNDTISVQQTQEKEIQDLKSKNKTLQKEQRNATVAYQKMSEKYQGLTAGIKRTKEENTTTVKKSKSSSSSSTIVEGISALDQINKSMQHPLGDIPQHDLLTAPNGDGKATVFPSTSSSNISSSSTDSNAMGSSSRQDQKTNQQKQDKKALSVKKIPLAAGKNALIGREIKKQFKGQGIFTGRVSSYRKPYYTVKYDDEDSEDMDEVEVHKWLAP
jgi:hypothetical protein